MSTTIDKTLYPAIFGPTSKYGLLASGGLSDTGGSGTLTVTGGVYGFNGPTDVIMVIPIMNI
jgi:hypothetical protein